MILKSFKNLKRDEKQDKLYNIFQTTVVNNNNIELFEYVVKREDEMRIDKVSTNIYNSNQYTEELMVLNNIIDPWSIKEGDIIYFCTLDDIQKLYSDDDDYYVDIEKLLDKSQNKSTKIDPSRKILNPVIKPKNLKQINVNKNNHKIQIINSFD